MTELLAGRELDATVAKALGWTEWNGNWMKGNDFKCLVSLWCPSVRDADALTALREVIRARPGYYAKILVLDPEGKGDHVSIRNRSSRCMAACLCRPLAEAICRVILEMVEAESMLRDKKGRKHG